ncbi:MAG TPA: choice-of-anchor D domain-containing protein [Candidatus Angelobacter sp.]|nr:choice-of-anchor D domain-containing protein [Candidatus Angelobacter sp.]
MNVHVRRTFLVASLCVFALLPSLSFAQKTIHVPADVPDIQTALFMAQDGDTVLVAPGSYFGSITFQGRSVTVMSSDGAAVTTVDGGFQPNAQFFENENNGAVLKGFTFINGSGIQISSASPIIEDNVIANNQGCQAGGIMVSSGSPIIRRNTITNNVQFCSGAVSAGGIAVAGQGNVQILNNTITGNQTAPGVQAGGIRTDAFGTTTITGNKIQNNFADAEGGGIFANGSDVIIADNLITGNSASAGGGIQIFPGSNAVLVNNTVAFNKAQQGAQLALDGMAGTVSLFNNLFYDLTGNGAIFCSVAGFTGFPPAQNNDAISFAGDPAGPPAAAYTGSCSDQTGLNGNIQVSPQFIDPVNADFHLSPSSPLVDAGNSAAPDLPAQDLDGNPRIAAGSNLCLPIVDIGAYEIVFNSVGSASLGTSNLTFGEAFIGVPSFFTQPVTLTGTGGCAQITSITTSSDYQQTNNCSVLRVGDSCTIQVTFAPQIAGVRLGALRVNLLSPQATLSAELSGTAMNSATVTPAEVKFGIQAIQTTQVQSVNVTSTNGQLLVVSSISITGGFEQFSNCTFNSNACFISVQFTPTVAGPRTGMLTVVSNLGTFAVPLSGNGAAPTPSLSPTSLSFPTQAVGTASAPQSITLTNNGTADLLWNSVFSTPDFQIIPGNCGQLIPAGASCTFTVVFAPTIAAPISGSVGIDTNGGSITATATGIGTVPIASLSPQVLNFANRPLNFSSAAQTISVTNISGAPLQLTSLSAPDNFLATSSCPAVLDVNATCGIGVVFDPSSAGPYGGFLTLGTSLGPVTAALTVGNPHTFHVPSEVFSISQAVQLAQDGDTILVAPGTYFEQINFQGKAITIASTGGAAVTTLDGQGFQTPVFFFQNEGQGSVLKGFTVTHGGFAGIAAIGASPTIQDNIITENSGCQGGGIQLQTSQAIIKGNTISNNMIGSCSGDGAGIWIGQGSNVQVFNNVITGNQITGNGFGGGIAVSGSIATITSNTIQNNSTDFASGGGIAMIGGGSANIIQNLITGNSAGFAGGGVMVAPGVFPSTQLINNTIADNFAPNGSGLFFNGSDGSQAFANNIIVDSSGSTAIACNSNLIGNFSFNDVFSFASGTAYGPGCGDQTSIAGNISQNPQFVNSAAENYRLQPSSPAIDAGTNFPGNSFPPPLPDRDLDGNGRILPGNAATCNGVVDLGAYEFATAGNGIPGPLPASWDFGSWQVGGQASPFIFNLTAQGCVTIASIQTTGDFRQENSCNNAVSSFRGCNISVSFNPQHPGLRTGSLIVDYGASAPPVTVALTGQGIGNPPLASPTSVSFGPQAVGTSSAAQQVFIFPNSAAPMTVNAIWISGNFSQTNSCGLTNPPTGAGCVINVVFTPTGPNSGQGTLNVSTNQGVVVVPLNGVVDSGPAPSFSQSPLNFGSQPVGTTTELDVTLSNTGTAALSFDIGIGPDFIQTNNCPQPLPAGSSCIFRVRFSPTIAGTFNESLTLTGNGNPPTAQVTLTGTGIGPLPSFAPASLTFAAQLAGTTSAAQSVTLSNTGNAALAITGFAVNGDFSESDNCGTSLPAGSTCTLNIVFKPTADGTRNGSVTLVSNFNGLPLIRLTGTGQAVQASVSPASLTFLPILVGTSSATQAVTYTNTGSLPISITGLSTTGDFAQTNTCGTTLAAEATCTATVTFTPTARGTRTGSLNIAGNFTGTAPVVNLSGTGQVQQGTVTPTALSFADQQVGTTSAQQNVTLTNTGDGPFSISSITANGDFVVSNGCPATLAVGSSCQIGVAFAPTALGSRTGAVLFTTTANINPVNLTGNGIGPNPVFSPSSLNFGAEYVGVASAAQSVTLTNTGTMTLTISSFTITADYEQTNNCGASLAPGASCILNVDFRPTTTGLRTGTLFVTGNVFGTPPPVVTLSGTGTVFQVTASPATLTFAAAPLNTSSAAQTVTFTNRSDLPVAITGVTINGDFTQTNTCQSPLAVAASCTVNVVFKPTVRGTRTGTLSFTSNSPGTPPVVTLSGTGQAILATASPASLTFPAAPLNTTSTAQAVTFTNTGDLPVAITGVTIIGDFAQTNNCGTSLAVGASCILNVTFTPTARGSRTGMVTLQGNFTTPAPVITLAGTGQAFVASLTPASFNFSDEPVNTTTNPQVFIYTNTGDLPLSISGVAVTPDFNQTNTCPATLAVGANCTINVTFLPRAVGTQTASLTVSANVNSSASLTGNGVMPTASLSPASLDFGHQRIGMASVPQLVTVTNTGAYAFFINQVSFPGGYQITNNCPTVVNPGTNCTLSVVYAPTSLQSGVGSLTIGGDFTATPSSVSLSGTADADTGTLSPTALTFGSQVVGSTSVSQTVTLSSTGTVPINLSSIQVTGDFSQTNNCGTSVAPGSNCIITVTFAPTAHGTRSGVLTVSGDFTSAAPSATLSGNGTTPTASWSPASLTFSNQLVGSSSSAQIVTLTNSGDGPLTISAITASGDFTQTNACGSTLAAGANCTINVTFTPSATGSRSGSLSLNSNSSAAVSPISLAGTGVAPLAALSPASLSFANQAVNTTSVAQIATLTNNGTAALAISSITVTGDFAQTNNCGSSLAAGANCTINITFQPSATGSRTGSLNISDNSLNGSSQTAALSGTGIDFSLSASPASVSINAGLTANYTVTVASLGSAFSAGVSLSCSGLPAASSCTFSPASVTPGNTPVNSALQVATTQRHKQTGTPAGTYTVTIIGTSGSVQHSTTVHLTVN